MVRQPGDGSCLFHSLAYGLAKQGRHTSAHALRAQLMDWLAKHEDARIADTRVSRRELSSSHM